MGRKKLIALNCKEALEDRAIKDMQKDLSK
jgi:hypothetical protein